MSLLVLADASQAPPATEGPPSISRVGKGLSRLSLGLGSVFGALEAVAAQISGDAEGEGGDRERAYARLNGEEDAKSGRKPLILSSTRQTDTRQSSEDKAEKPKGSGMRLLEKLIPSSFMVKLYPGVSEASFSSVPEGLPSSRVVHEQRRHGDASPAAATVVHALSNDYDEEAHPLAPHDLAHLSEGEREAINPDSHGTVLITRRTNSAQPREPPTVKGSGRARQAKEGSPHTTAKRPGKLGAPGGLPRSASYWTKRPEGASGRTSDEHSRWPQGPMPPEAKSKPPFPPTKQRKVRSAERVQHA